MIINPYTLIFLLSFIFFVLGLIIGSFLNVVICRMNTRRSLGGRSACMSCQYKLCWYELIPLFSFLILRGRCRNCKTRISLLYPIVEFTTGIIFFLLFLKFSAIGGPASGGQDLYFWFNTRFLFIYAYYAVIGMKKE